MKIAFICGSLQAGKDGVGDYTRRLAGEIIRNNHHVVAIAINDNHINTLTEEQQDADGTPLKVLRLTASTDENSRLAALEQYLKDFNPDWISLQYVPFSYHKKGLPYKLGSRLSKIGKPYKWHIMFHELWVGLHGKVTKKKLVLGYLQKLLIKDLIRRIKPACITTSIPLYQSKLAISNVELLPLFSNIAISHKRSDLPFMSDNMFSAVHFGGFSAYVDEFEAQLIYLQNVAASYNKKLQFVTIGEGGSNTARSLQMAARILVQGVITEKGRLSEAEISDVLLNSDIGISKADAVLYGKSGSTMAMFEHGLPVLLRGKQTQNANINNNMLYKDRVCFVGQDIKTLAHKQPPQEALANCAVKFLAMLNA
jgi:hypothetical protein